MNNFKTLLLFVFLLIISSLLVAQDEIPTYGDYAVKNCFLEFKNDQFRLYTFEKLNKEYAIVLGRYDEPRRYMVFLLDEQYHIADEKEVPGIPYFSMDMNINPKGEYPLYIVNQGISFISEKNGKLSIRKEAFTPMMQMPGKIQAFGKDYIYTTYNFNTRVVRVISSEDKQIGAIKYSRKVKSSVSAIDVCQVSRGCIILFHPETGKTTLFDKNYDVIKEVNIPLTRIHSAKYKGLRMAPLTEKADHILLVYSIYGKRHTLYNFNINTKQAKLITVLEFPYVSNFRQIGDKLYFISHENRKSKDVEENALLFFPWKISD